MSFYLLSNAKFRIHTNLKGEIYTNLVTKYSYTKVKDKKTNEDLERTQLKKGRQMKTLIEVVRNVVMDYIE